MKTNIITVSLQPKLKTPCRDLLIIDPGRQNSINFIHLSWRLLLLPQHKYTRMLSRTGFIVALFCVGVLVGSVSSFVPPHALQPQQQQRCSGLPMTAGGRDASSFCRKQTILFSVPSEDDSTSETMASSAEEPLQTPAASPKEPEGSQYPLNVPSPLLLASAMLLAIASTGRYCCELFLYFSG